MSDDPKPISPLRQRMIEDMTLRKLGMHTQTDYIRAVRNLAAWLRRSPDTATAEDLRRYQLHLVEQGVPMTTINPTITGLRFFFETTLGRPETMAGMRHLRERRRLPEVLSREEAARLIGCAGNLKYKAVLSVAYGSGLRASEVAHLKVGDVDSQRMCLRVERGKGQRRSSPPSHALLLHRAIEFTARAPSSPARISGQLPRSNLGSTRLLAQSP